MKYPGKVCVEDPDRESLDVRSVETLKEALVGGDILASVRVLWLACHTFTPAVMVNWGREACQVGTLSHLEMQQLWSHHLREDTRRLGKAARAGVYYYHHRLRCVKSSRQDLELCGPFHRQSLPSGIGPRSRHRTLAACDGVTVMGYIHLYIHMYIRAHPCS